MKMRGHHYRRTGGYDKALYHSHGTYGYRIFKGEPEKRPFTIKDGKAYGPGVLDMKGGVTILLSTLKALHEAGFEDFPCKVILDADEEPAHVFSNAPEVIQKKRKEPNVPLILKPASQITVWWYSVKDAGVSSLRPSAAAVMWAMIRKRKKCDSGNGP